MSTRLGTRTHLFVLTPPASGSTALLRFLETSPNASTFATEGQSVPGAREIMHVGNRWDPTTQFDWNAVRRHWEAHWDMTCPVLVEKSPPNIMRADQLRATFENAHFVVMVRNPYAYCEGVWRRHAAGKRSMSDIAKNWLRQARYQVYNRSLPRSTFFTYEQFTDDTPACVRRLIELVPELERFDHDAVLPVHERRQPLTNMNARQIEALTPTQFDEINEVLRWHQGLLQSFGYDLMD